MAVNEVLTMASRLVSSFGSGTFSMRTSFFPYQQTAFIDIPPAMRGILMRKSGRVARGKGFFGGLRDGVRVRVVVWFLVVAGCLRTGGLTACARQHARFDASLETLEIGANAGRRIVAKQLGGESPERAARRRIHDFEADFRATTAGGIFEVHGAGIRHFRPVERAP